MFRSETGMCSSASGHTTNKRSECLKAQVGRTRACLVTCFVAGLLLGCVRGPMLPYSLETPPLVLVPAQMANVDDGRARFREIFCSVQKDHGSLLPNNRPCGDALQRLADEESPGGKPVWLGMTRVPMKVVVVPGLFNECFSNITWPFAGGLRHIERFGFSTAIIPVSGRSSSEVNARQIRDALLDFGPESKERIVLVGYSKGTADILEAVTAYPEVTGMVSAVVSITGVVGGSPIADHLSWPMVELVRHLPFSACPTGDGGAIESIKRSTRQLWLARNRLPTSILYFSLGAFDERKGISFLLRRGYDDLSLVDPRNDGQVVFTDSVIPGATLLGYAKADHWAVAMGFTEALSGPILSTLLDKNAFPREILFEAIIRSVEERLYGAGL